MQAAIVQDQNSEPPTPSKGSWCTIPETTWGKMLNAVQKKLCPEAIVSFISSIYVVMQNI